MDLNAIFSSILKDTIDKSIEIKAIKNLSGGCINNAYRLDTTFGIFFIKYNSGQKLDMFQAESDGLKILKKSESIQVPEVIGYGKVPEFSYLILEYMESSSPKRNYWEDFGEKLSLLHRTTNSYFGLSHPNFIGSLPQINNPDASWINFFIEKRLRFQLKMAINDGKITNSYAFKFEHLFRKLPELLPEEKPALLHGDLWSGNVMVNKEGGVILIDPAIYFGHREVELAFTTLFGGFDSEFYESYNRSYPLESGFEDRTDLYNLYPLLVHVNLFGGGYINSIIQILNRFI